MKKILYTIIGVLSSIFLVFIIGCHSNSVKVTNDNIGSDTIYWTEDSLLQNQGSMNNIQIDSIKKGLKKDYSKEGLKEKVSY